MQILWLFGENHEITEVGAMNIFFLFRKENRPDSPLELVTAPLDRGDVLPGVTRNSVLNLCRSEWGKKEFGAGLEVSEKWITMNQVKKAAEEGRVSEILSSLPYSVSLPLCLAVQLSPVNDILIPPTHSPHVSCCRACCMCVSA
jgi:branched-chain amino acid aminotransferase